ncbi:hypothetical protein BKA70DRAFT_1428162 [Coprinopsis sp. MPI-PUGE-AT-0042]|nr:hypothetical protein BKA70DRAFT_1428162 [Coprinopsis sp. MPI-PUGE-AT-0042]
MAASFYASPMLRFALRAETDIPAWNRFLDQAEQSEQGATHLLACSARQCKDSPNGCIPARSIISCTACIRSFSPCNLAVYVLRDLFINKLDLKKEEALSFLESYTNHRNIMVEELSQNPMASNADAFTSARWEITALHRKSQYEEHSEVEENEGSFPKVFESLGRLAVRGTITQVLLCLKIAHLSSHIDKAQEASRAWLPSSTLCGSSSDDHIFSTLDRTTMLLEDNE